MQNRKKPHKIRWDIILFINGFMLLVTALFLMSKPTHALVGVGEEIDCITDNPFVAAFGNFGLDNNDAEAQTFTVATTVTVSAFKINAYKWTVPDGAILNVHITDTNTGATTGAPDMNSILASETWDTTLLPVFDQVIYTNNNFSCDPDVDSAQTVIFDPPVVLSGGTTYAFVIEGSGTADPSGNDMVLGYRIPANDYYTGGQHWECNIPTSCALLTPGTWDLTGGPHDVFGAAWFDNITIVSPVNFDSWITNFLTHIGMNSTFGKAAFASAVGLTAMLAILFRKGPPLIALAIGGMLSIVFVGATLLPPSVLLTMFAIVGIAIMFGVLRGFRNSGGIE